MYAWLNWRSTFHINQHTCPISLLSFWFFFGTFTPNNHKQVQHSLELTTLSLLLKSAYKFIKFIVCHSFCLNIVSLFNAYMERVLSLLLSTQSGFRPCVTLYGNAAKRYALVSSNIHTQQYKYGYLNVSHYTLTANRETIDTPAASELTIIHSIYSFKQQNSTQYSSRKRTNHFLNIENKKVNDRIM